MAVSTRELAPQEERIKESNLLYWDIGLESRKLPPLEVALIASLVKIEWLAEAPGWIIRRITAKAYDTKGKTVPKDALESYLESGHVDSNLTSLVLGFHLKASRPEAALVGKFRKRKSPLKMFKSGTTFDEELVDPPTDEYLIPLGNLSTGSIITWSPHHLSAHVSTDARHYLEKVRLGFSYNHPDFEAEFTLVGMRYENKNWPDAFLEVKLGNNYENILRRIDELGKLKEEIEKRFGKAPETT